MDHHCDEELEEGEISGNDDDNYTPLERPSNYTTTVQPQTNVSEEVESEAEENLKSSSDSDSDSNVKPKRQKLKPKLKTLPKDPAKKKYDIWCNAAQEDALESLVNCDVSNIDRSRNVETYTYRKNNKRTCSDRRNINFRPKKRTHFIENNEHPKLNQLPRDILDLQFTTDDSTEDIARDISNKLFEEKEDLIKSVVEIAGKEKAIKLFKETQLIEECGGLMVVNNVRRRTPGGVFLYLVKNDSELTQDQQNEIFGEDKLKFKQEVRTRRKIKMQQIKQQIKAEAAKRLPDLVSHRKLEYEPKTINDEIEVDVKNPPPSPATDILDSNLYELENPSGKAAPIKFVDNNDDCIEISVNEMDFV